MKIEDILTLTLKDSGRGGYLIHPESMYYATVSSLARIAARGKVVRLD